MPHDRSKVSTLSAELAAYSATFSNRGLTLIGELWSDGTYQVHAIRTTGSTQFGQPAQGPTVKDAVNALLDVLGLAATSTHPIFP